MYNKDLLIFVYFLITPAEPQRLSKMIIIFGRFDRFFVKNAILKINDVIFFYFMYLYLCNLISFTFFRVCLENSQVSHLWESFRLDLGADWRTGQPRSGLRRPEVAILQLEAGQGSGAAQQVPWSCHRSSKYPELDLE
jgi:hypothetical protein